MIRKTPRIAGTEPSVDEDRLTMDVALKISAVEGLHMTPRIARLIQDTRHLPDDVRRQRVIALFSKSSA